MTTSKKHPCHPGHTEVSRMTQNWTYGNRHQLPSGRGGALAVVDRVDVVVDAEYEERAPRRVPSGRIVVNCDEGCNDNDNGNGNGNGNGGNGSNNSRASATSTASAATGSRGAPWLVVLLLIGLLLGAGYLLLSPTEEVAPSVAVTEQVQVRTVGYDGEAVVAHIIAPSGWTLHWERNGQLLDSVTGEQSVAGDIAIYLPPADASGVYPVLVWGSVEKKGNPIP